MPSFTQTANATSGCNSWGCYDDDGDFNFYPIEVRPEPREPREPWDPWDDPDPYPPTCDYIGDPDCESEDEDDDGGGDDDSGFCTTKSNTELNLNGGNDRQCTKDEYCEIKGKTQTFLRAVNIVNTANTIFTVGGIFADYALSSLRNGYWDIESFIASAGTTRRLYYGSLNATINWHAADINWYDYDDSWNALDRGRPTRGNGGAQHIMAEYMLSLGIGNNAPVRPGVPVNLLPADPDPSTSCN